MGKQTIPLKQQRADNLASALKFSVGGGGSGGAGGSGAVGAAPLINRKWFIKAYSLKQGVISEL